jgi:hypothetical protein
MQSEWIFSRLQLKTFYSSLLLLLLLVVVVGHTSFAENLPSTATASKPEEEKALRRIKMKLMLNNSKIE